MLQEARKAKEPSRMRFCEDTSMSSEVVRKLEKPNLWGRLENVRTDNLETNLSTYFTHTNPPKEVIEAVVSYVRTTHPDFLMD